MSRLPEQVQGEGVILRRYRDTDTEAMHALVSANVEHLRPWMGWISFEPLTVEDRRELVATWEQEWAAGGDLTVGIWLDGDLVGGAGLHRRIGPGGLEIGYWVGTAYVGRGIATAAARALTDLAFTVEGIEAVEIHHDASNLASRRIPEKLGFERWGRVGPNRPLRGTAETGVDDVWRMTRTAWLRPAT